MLAKTKRWLPCGDWRASVRGATSTARAGEADEGNALAPGHVPEGRFTRVVTVCRDCAGKAGVPVGTVGDDELPCYHQLAERGVG